MWAKCQKYQCGRSVKSINVGEVSKVSMWVIRRGGSFQLLLHCVREFRGDEKIREYVWALITPSHRTQKNRNGKWDQVRADEKLCFTQKSIQFPNTMDLKMPHRTKHHHQWCKYCEWSKVEESDFMRILRNNGVKDDTNSQNVINWGRFRELPICLHKKTFLTCISVSAVAINGVVEGGGAYVMISRNLGPAFGCAVGILLYLANTAAIAMYLVGGIEILLLYLRPGMTIGGRNAHTDTGFLGMLSNNMRLYATFVLIVQFTIVAMGVRFVKLLAPVSLVCVIHSVLACYAGAVEKTITGIGEHVCMIGDHLLQTDAVLLDLAIKFSAKDNSNHLLKASCVNGFPGFSTDTFWGNFHPNYSDPIKGFQDVKTSHPYHGHLFPRRDLHSHWDQYERQLGQPAEVHALGNGISLDGRMVVAQLAWPTEWVVLIGSFLSTFGAALQSLCSASRLLQSIAKDNVIPFLKRFAKVTKSNEPFLGLLSPLSSLNLAF
ncbi:hypothetical protein niasHT_038757 [Heterodera trifolii]|uniref:Amino acid permease/ SLC12A domain-containing protein n=1 Tax=Heterodera trifolii TaxID=157864 RepID=A0ABD2ISP4_9BILA